MKKIILSLGLMSLFMLFTAMSCDDDDNPTTCLDILQNLQSQKEIVETLAATSVCNENFECRYIAFGSKACGGPKTYLIYTTSIDTLALASLVQDYNQLESEYNVTCNQISDCTAPQPPIGFDCDNNQCIPVF